MIILFLLILLVICLVFGLIGCAFKVTGSIISAALWLVVKLPLAILFCVIGLVCCCTLLLIPVGLGLFKAAGHILAPACAVI